MAKSRKEQLLSKLRAMRGDKAAPVEEKPAPPPEPKEERPAYLRPKEELYGEHLAEQGQYDVTPPEGDDPESPMQPAGERAESMLDRLNRLTENLPEESIAIGDEVARAPKTQAALVQEIQHQDAPAAAVGVNNFFPKAPETLEESGLNRSKIEELIMKYLLARGEDSGQGIADQLRLPFNITNEVLRFLKKDQLIHYKDTANLNDYVSSLTDKGRDRARRYSMRCTYYGAAPIPLHTYIASVSEQSLTRQRPKEEDLKRAFSDLLINPKMLVRIGAALNSGRGMFLFGFPGNGKTSIAERVTKAFGESIWIPRAIGIDGEIIRLFDPSQHEEMPIDKSEGIYQEEQYDGRWVRIRRPTIIVGGELTMDNLELSINNATGINEAPVQLKSNCGTLVIDDFGRQRMTTDELLNRWIVPLEKRYDFLNLPSGKKIEVPFDQLVVFSTNLEPKDLVDDAFLRRIPYKIEVENPSESEFRQLFRIMCPKFEIPYNDKAIDYLIKKHYAPVDRPYRCCHPRDLLLQVRNLCQYQGSKLEMTPKGIDFACDNYFSIM